MKRSRLPVATNTPVRLAMAAALIGACSVASAQSRNQQDAVKPDAVIIKTETNAIDAPTLSRDVKQDLARVPSSEGKFTRKEEQPESTGPVPMSAVVITEEAAPQQTEEQPR